MPHVEIELARVPFDIPTPVEHAGRKLVILRTESRTVAYEDACPHASWPLSQGTLHDGVLECPGHGWEFSADTGRCVNAPAYCLTPISLEIREGIVRLDWESNVPSPASK
jgi:nitrite reductase/ring-hydroxylating ferredoxin subunit